MRREEQTSRAGRVSAGVAVASMMLSSSLIAQVEAEREPQLQIEELDEILITGSRLKLKDPEGTSPVTVFDVGRIEELGAATITELFNFLPQQSYSRGEDYRTHGAQFVELRGLGADTTLVLINGRRTVPSAATVSSNAFDLNTMPLSAVERVEVLSDSASAVYGADAVGGVVNIILKREISGTTFDVRYGTAEGGGDEQRVSLSTGLSTARARASLIFDYLRKDHLLGAERERWRDQDFRRFGGIDQRSLNAQPGNVSSRTAANLPGLPSPFAAVPVGSSGMDLAPEDFAATAGQRNYESLAAWASIVPEAERYSAALFGELDVLPALHAFAEVLYTDRRSDNQSSPSALSSTRVPASNPFNPFGVDVTTNYLLTELGPRHAMAESELWRAVAGLRGAIGNWDWELSILTSEEDAANWTENAVNAALATQALASTDPASALNVFGDENAGSAQLLSSILATPVVNEFSSEGSQVAGFVRGPALTLPAGELAVVLGGEWREEKLKYDSFLFVEEDREASAAFAEINVPLVDPSMGMPGMRNLSLKLAGRYDRYSDFGHRFNPQYGLLWTPIEPLLLRASYGKSFRPPSLFELYAPRTTVPLPLTDPRRNNEVTAASAITGGNPELDPVEGESLTTGFVFTPSMLPGLRMSGSYWQIELEDRVAALPYQIILANETLFSDRVERAEPSPADIAAGLPGPIVSVDISRLNYGRIETSGIDAALSYAFETELGAWSAGLSATHVRSYEIADTPGAPPQERGGVAHVFGTIPDWRGVATLSWSRGPWQLTTNARYVSSYDDVSGTNVQPTGRRIDVPVLFDLQAAWDSDALASASGWSRGVKISAGVVNVTDEAPPFSEVGGSLGYDSSQGDLRQRFGYMTISKRF